jgi:hypothetical protein
MGNCGSNNDIAENAISSKSNQPTRRPPSAPKEKVAASRTSVQNQDETKKITKYKLTYFDFTGRAEVIR